MIEIADNPRHSGVKRKLEVFREIRIDQRSQYSCEVIIYHFEDDGSGGYGDMISGNPEKDPNKLFSAYKVSLPINNDILVNPATGNVLSPNFDGEDVLVDYTDVITSDTVSIASAVGEYDYVAALSTNDLSAIDAGIDATTPVLSQVNAFRDYTIQKMVIIGRLD